MGGAAEGAAVLCSWLLHAPDVGQYQVRDLAEQDGYDTAGCQGQRQTDLNRHCADDEIAPGIRARMEHTIDGHHSPAHTIRCVKLHQGNSQALQDEQYKSHADENQAGKNHAW